MHKFSLTMKYLVFAIFSIIILLPLFWTLYAAMIENDLFINSSVFQWDKYGFGNFVYITGKGDILVWLGNSAMVVTVITLANLLINSMAGYALARFPIKGKSIIFFYIIGIMMIPAQVLVIPLYLVIGKMGLINTYLALILPFIYNPFGVFLMRQFFLGFPKDIEDAARIDGLGTYGTYFRIVTPLSLNALLTQAIIIFVWNWNNFMLPSILVNTPDKFTIPLGIYQITNTQYTTSVTKSMAGAALALIPTVVFYIIFQKKLVNNNINSAIKG